MKIKKVICGDCRKEDLTFHFDVDKHIHVTIKKNTVTFNDGNGKIKTNKDLKKHLKNDVTISEISTECECMRGDVSAIVVFSNDKQKFDYGLFTEEEDMYREYLKNLLIKNL